MRFHKPNFAGLKVSRIQKAQNRHMPSKMEKCEEHRKLYAIFSVRNKHKWVFDWAEKALRVEG